MITHLMNEQEAGDYLGLSVYQMRKLRRRGLIATTDVVGSRFIRYQVEDLDDFKARARIPLALEVDTITRHKRKGRK